MFGGNIGVSFVGTLFRTKGNQKGTNHWTGESCLTHIQEPAGPSLDPKLETEAPSPCPKFRRLRSARGVSLLAGP